MFRFITILAQDAKQMDGQTDVGPSAEIRKAIDAMTGLSNEALNLWYGGAGQTNWRCEDHLKGLLDSFIKQWPECKPIGPRARRSLEVSARDLYEELGENPAFMEWAKEKIRRDSPHLTIKSLRSLLFLVPEWRTRKTEANDGYWD